MTEKEYENFIKILRDKLPENLKDMEIKPHFSLERDLLFNSILFYALLVDVEQTFGVTLKTVTMDAAVYQTIGDFAGYITQLLGEGKNGE